MVPFSPLMSLYDVTFLSHTMTVGGQGASRRTFPTPGVVLRADVQPAKVDRVDGDGRTYTTLVHVVYTATDPGMVAGDRVLWLDRTLAVEGRSTPKGIVDMTWRTDCIEEV